MVMSWGTVNSDTPFEAPTPLLVTGRNSSVDGKEEDSSSSFLAEKTRKAQKEKKRRRKRRKWLDKRISPPSRKTSQFMQKGKNIGNQKTNRQVRKMLNYYTSHIPTHQPTQKSGDLFLFFVFDPSRHTWGKGNFCFVIRIWFNKFRWILW